MLRHVRVDLFLDHAIIAAAQVAVEVQRPWLLLADWLALTIEWHEVLEVQLFLDLLKWRHNRASNRLDTSRLEL